MMRGWKTWIAGILSIAYGAIGWLVDLHGPDSAWQFVIQGLAIIGLGHKLEKSAVTIDVATDPSATPEKTPSLDDLVKRNQR